jgi:hypothetical protein
MVEVISDELKLNGKNYDEINEYLKTYFDENNIEKFAEKSEKEVLVDEAKRRYEEGLKKLQKK